MKPELRRLCPDGKPSLLVADNLYGQDARFSAGAIGRAAKASATSANCEWWNTVEGCTDAIQPVDAGLGRELKRHIGKTIQCSNLLAHLRSVTAIR